VKIQQGGAVQSRETEREREVSKSRDKDSNASVLSHVLGIRLPLEPLSSPEDGWVTALRFEGYLYPAFQESGFFGSNDDVASALRPREQKVTHIVLVSNEPRGDVRD
jgi:hypothetical protein